MKCAFAAVTLAAATGLSLGAVVSVESRQSTSFVKTSGQQFTLDGSRFTVVGSNAYWMAQLPTSADITTAFNDLKNAGFTTLRTWGFNEVTSPSGTYYQLWNGKTPTLNTGPDGLAKFDTVVAAAKVAGIRLIIPLTNNWSDYGGMDVYVKQLLGSNDHSLFYTDSAVKAAFKNYINGFVGRYKNEPTVMAWELANEPRCRGSTITLITTCNTKTITSWATEMSAYIKSIDPNHLVATGDEGFYNRRDTLNYPYLGSEGIDFDANLQISSIDFGTFHSYPETWGQLLNAADWGTQWIKGKYHAISQKNIGKPVIIEEFGVKYWNQASTYTKWWDAIISSGLAGDLIWQAGSTVSTGKTSDDGYAVFPGEAEYTLQTKYAAALKARS
ncbi:Cellulase (glycosyl hydrolase family 5 protein) [Ceratobasidium sp. AG-Ba]|nr:Cellulase (glycosyl hydrolase family 5 protein) [Ceratobasidium sp. AG-Ba]QRW08169.1 Cellulase (glycosyl hydrolase family 5 protein) [Ceratobasidium sp. AG-Ba]